MQQGRVRAIAICIIRRGDDIFVAEGVDDVKSETFYRPLGGTIEFGEHSRHTVVRELREELSAAVSVGRYLGAIENIFTYNGQTGHEIVIVYEAVFIDPAFYRQEAFDAIEDNQIRFRAYWKPLEMFRNGKALLYPSGLLKLLSTIPASSSMWFKEIYDLFAPLRVAAADMTEEEINAAIDEAVAEVRRKKHE